MSTTISNTALQIWHITVPVALRKIKTDNETRLSFAGPDGQAVEQQYLDVRTRQVVSRDDLIKGQWDGDSFRSISKDDLDAIDERLKLDSLRITECVKLSEIPWERTLATYYLAPPSKTRGAVETLALLHKALVKSKSAGVLKMTLRTRTHLAVVYPKGDALYVTTLCYAKDWQQADEANVLAGVAVEKAHVDTVCSLIDTMTMSVADALDTKVDEVQEERAKLIEAALAGKPIKKGEKKAVSPTANSLMEQLEASLRAAQEGKDAA